MARKDAGIRDTVLTGCYRHLGFRKGMAIISLNINGLRSHHDEIDLLLNDPRIHILALKETKLDASVRNEFTESSVYQQKRLDRTCDGGGVTLYVRASIKMKPRDDVEISPPKSKLFLVVAWYRPLSDLVDSFDKLEKALAYLDKEGKKLLSLVIQIVVFPKS